MEKRHAWNKIKKEEKPSEKLFFFSGLRGLALELKIRKAQKAHLGLLINLQTKFQTCSSIRGGMVFFQRQ